VAYLPGGHTSKRLPADFLVRRDVDALVLLAEASADPNAVPRYARQVEQRVPSLRGAASFQPVGRLPLNPRQDYVVLRRSEATP